MKKALIKFAVNCLHFLLHNGHGADLHCSITVQLIIYRCIPIIGAGKFYLENVAYITSNPYSLHSHRPGPIQ